MTKKLQKNNCLLLIKGEIDMSSTRYIIVTLLKVLVVIALVIILFVAGTMIGYGVIGGGNPKDVFKEEIWTHISDFFK
ncbi:hypothetical protein I580_00436 [Enterococcus caccae ATCC BAA-1240]|uniref:DNA-directed RNA polymerase subunit beta n=2 Tax=Enterococcus caccae TaxID=317735 RepID=R3W735_9ENTE|nr:hypothetical protein UC7_02876 [Enterococcus caccae ATCC BAA-1240]EOT68054.1 hypothetical protein I580_00436 [Enterococcus caccae ATCC BAA-1240]